MQGFGQDNLGVRRQLRVTGVDYEFFSLEAVSNKFQDISRLPFSIKVILENLLRHEDGRSVKIADIEAVVAWLTTRSSTQEIAFRPARVLMQDFTGVPALVDLAAMRQASVEIGCDPYQINPQLPVDLVIDHSIQADTFGLPDALQRNVELEYERNAERFAFLRWGAQAFKNFRVFPPGTGICHQVNLEYLSQVVRTESNGNTHVAFPDTVIGTDSHTTMANGLGVLGWGVGGIEAEAVMLGQPVSMLMPEVIGFKLSGNLPEGTTATDLVLTITQMLRAKRVVGKFVEFFGSGLDGISVADRATIGNMAPEYGATCGIFPIDQPTLDYLHLTNREPRQVALVEAYAKAQGMWRDASAPDPAFTDTLELDMSNVAPCLAGPKRPQDRVLLSGAKQAFEKALPDLLDEASPGVKVQLDGAAGELTHGDVVIAAITSCTNTSNPHVMVAAGLLARNARKRGLKPKPYVKTSLAPGSKVVTDYLGKLGLMDDLEALGFHLVGYGCTTCNGNSGPLPEPVAKAIDKGGLVVNAVLSGNRNFEGRVHAQVKASYLASPPLVIAYALAGSLLVDLTQDPLGTDIEGKPVYLTDIWPTSVEVHTAIRESLNDTMYHSAYQDTFRGDEGWAKIKVGEGQVYDWDGASTYCRNPPYFERFTADPERITDIEDARILVLLGDGITTDHISPVGSIAKTSPAANYLAARHIHPENFNSYGSRRGNHEVMLRGMFANIRLRNEMTPRTSGGFAKLMPEGQVTSVYDAAMAYQQRNVPLLIIGGKEYGTGSSRDWAAKGSALLGVKAVIAESFERIHRSNLVSMGVLPLVFKHGASRISLALDGSEVFDIRGIADGIAPGMDLTCTIKRTDGSEDDIPLLCHIETRDEADFYRHGGILRYVLRKLHATDHSADST